MQWRRSGRRVSARTMRRVRRQLHYYPVHVSVKPALTDAHKAARLAWCREHVRDSVKSLVFMDEMGVWIDYHKQLIGSNQANQGQSKSWILLKLG